MKFPSSFTISKIDKFDFNINVLSNRLENKWGLVLVIRQSSLIGSNYWLNSLAMNLGENNFKHLSQQFETEVLNIFKQKGFHH